MALLERVRKLILGRRRRATDPERALDEREAKRLREQAKLQAEVTSGGPPPGHPGDIGGGSLF